MSFRICSRAAICSLVALYAVTLSARPPAESKPAQPPTVQAPPSPREWPVGRSFPAPTEQERRIRTAFEQLFAAGFEELTIAEIAKRVEAKAGCTVVVRDWELASGGIDLAAKLTGKAEGKALRKELRAFLRRHDLAAAVRQECLQITSIESAEVSFPTLRIYQVHDLVVAPNDPTADRPDFEQLIHRIRSFCAAESWRDNGGSICEIRAVEAPGLLGLAIVQSEETHEQIEDLLAMLRAARLPELAERQQRIAPPSTAQPVAGGTGGFGSAPVPPPRVPPPPPLPRGKVVYSKDDANLRIYDLLRKPAKFSFEDSSLGDVATKLSKDFGFPIELDIPALTADGKGAETIVTFRWTGGSLRSGLKMLLDPHGLTSVIAEGRLLITTKTAAETETPTRVYQVHDLFPRDLSLVGRKPDFHTLKWLVLDLISPEAWRDGGGEPGAIQGFETGGAQVLIIQITEVVHLQVESFFELIRDAKEPKVYEAQRRRGLGSAKAPPAKVSRATISPDGRSFADDEFGLSLRVGERLQIAGPTKDDPAGMLFAVTWLDRGPADDLKNPTFTSWTEPLKVDAPRSPEAYLEYCKKETYSDPNNWVGWMFEDRVKTESINGVGYVVAEMEHDGTCGIVSYLTIRNRHALWYWLRYGSRDDLPEMKKVLTAVQYRD